MEMLRERNTRLSIMLGGIHSVTILLTVELEISNDNKDMT